MQKQVASVRRHACSFHLQLVLVTMLCTVVVIAAPMFLSEQQGCCKGVCEQNILGAGSVLQSCRYDSDVNVADRWNGTPLMAALRNGHLAIAKMLMSCEAKLGDNADPALVQVISNFQFRQLPAS